MTDNTKNIFIISLIVAIIILVVFVIFLSQRECYTEKEYNDLLEGKELLSKSLNKTQLDLIDCRADLSEYKNRSCGLNINLDFHWSLIIFLTGGFILNWLLRMAIKDIFFSKNRSRNKSKK